MRIQNSSSHKLNHFRFIIIKVERKLFSLCTSGNPQRPLSFSTTAVELSRMNAPFARSFSSQRPKVILLGGNGYLGTLLSFVRSTSPNSTPGRHILKEFKRLDRPVQLQVASRAPPKHSQDFSPTENRSGGDGSTLKQSAGARLSSVEILPFMRCDVTRHEEVERACDGADVVVNLVRDSVVF